MTRLFDSLCTPLRREVAALGAARPKRTLSLFGDPCVDPPSLVQ